MNLKTTLILLIAGLVAGAWVWWDLRQPPAAELDDGPLLAAFPADAVRRLVLERPPSSPQAGSGRERLVFEKRGRQWWLTEPLQGPADERKVEEMIQSPCTRWPSNHVPAAADPDLFGLGADAIRVTLVHSAGEASFRIGRHTEFENAQYARVEGAARVALMDMDFAKPYALPPRAYLREKGAAKESRKNGSASLRPATERDSAASR